MFRFTQEPSAGSQSQCLAKIADIVPLCLSIGTWSVLWPHIPAIAVICRHNTDHIPMDKHSGTISAILARH